MYGLKFDGLDNRTKVRLGLLGSFRFGYVRFGFLYFFILGHVLLSSRKCPSKKVHWENVSQENGGNEMTFWLLRTASVSCTFHLTNKFWSSLIKYSSYLRNVGLLKSKTYIRVNVISDCKFIFSKKLERFIIEVQFLFIKRNVLAFYEKRLLY